MKLAIDLDNVVLQTEKAMKAIWRARGGGKPDTRLYSWGNREHIARVVRELHESGELRTLKPYPGAVDALRLLRTQGHDILYVSSRPVNDSAVYADTEASLSGLGLLDNSDRQSTLYLVGNTDKADFVADEGVDVLLDDDPRVLAAAKSMGVPVLCYSQPWNEEYVNFTRVTGWKGEGGAGQALSYEAVRALQGVC
jgi:predicted metal-dependent HD superfamily phosphohydrolase